MPAVMHMRALIPYQNAHVLCLAAVVMIQSLHLNHKQFVMIQSLHLNHKQFVMIQSLHLNHKQFVVFHIKLCGNNTLIRNVNQDMHFNEPKAEHYNKNHL